MARVVCLGIAVLDRIYEVESIPAEPVKVTALDYRETGGGMAATAAVAVAALGGEAAFWGRLGADASGDAVLRAMAERGVNVDNVRRTAEGRTPTAAVLVEPGGERLLAVFTGSLAEDATWLPGEDLANAGAVLGDGRWRDGTLALFEAARAHGVPSVLDADTVPRDVLRPMVAGVDFALFSKHGLARYADEADPSRGLRRVAKATDALVGVTLGANGFLWLDRGRERCTPAFAVKPQDTTGAGDVFHGAYALALAEGRGPAEAARFACAAGAIKCARGMGWDGMPGRSEVDNLMMEGINAALGR